MFADSTTNTAMCRCSLLVWFFFFLCADTTWWLSWDPYALPFSPADEATTSKRQLDPLPSQLSRKDRTKKEKKIHNAETHIRELQSSINMIKIFVLLTIMDITQSVDILGLSAKLHQMTEDNSSWFGDLLQFQPGKIITRKNFTDPNCMFCFCVSMQLHISNTEHVQCACNDYKLQELTFKCLNLYFVRVIRTLKGGIVELQIVFKCLT